MTGFGGRLLGPTEFGFEMAHRGKLPPNWVCELPAVVSLYGHGQGEGEDAR